ncbi:hypothetical protein MJO28_006943 [Puccinia striiformis f. sp. tritici]|uniref:Uncharacterized protein n=3 Tax=Puccinia striiformis TaxID=27350 RepID=A0A0L0VGU9_9BASI|nr:hypothetical protein Pst134EA_013057 [Puccinia striiformis f. sp. tritici]KAI9621973.1 hypothetical protein H4Q26_015410 [Puccinia striiformis f. sp. tritici PST-130]KNE98502.1 hypothetical protein PSTG_08241 [Puccinia striiformis f. sp. tritici PST-78]POW13751.1 hypothetical protein PSTT_03471 [Puccinia striiformis]KAH9465164.1 hypothetical protein Pst134EA_013057 [Puccinia striiformis f. sp. tritici]KAI7951259.1 hypothetical protein MJO28_006943 [Puccinia striiformis f. sp. tritici]
MADVPISPVEALPRDFSHHRRPPQKQEKRVSTPARDFSHHRRPPVEAEAPQGLTTQGRDFSHHRRPPQKASPKRPIPARDFSHHRRPPQKAAPQQPPTTSRDFSHHRRPPQRVVPRQRPALSSSRPERPKGIVFCVDNLPQEVEDLGGAGTPLVPFYVKDLKELPSFGGSDTSL